MSCYPRSSASVSEAMIRAQIRAEEPEDGGSVSKAENAGDPQDGQRTRERGSAARVLVLHQEVPNPLRREDPHCRKYTPYVVWHHPTGTTTARLLYIGSTQVLHENTHTEASLSKHARHTTAAHVSSFTGEARLCAPPSRAWSRRLRRGWACPTSAMPAETRACWRWQSSGTATTWTACRAAS